jgi:transketolase
MTPVSGKAIRRIVLEQSRRAHVGHVGSALSVADMLAAVFAELDPGPPGTVRHPERDRFILSKGHAALALYAALACAGRLEPELLDRFCADGSLLGTHPERALPGVDFSTGSLGLGLSFGAGAALAARLQRSPRRCFVLMSDAELNEGSTWEAAMFAGHHRLDRLVALVDRNGQQALGPTREVLDLPGLGAAWQSLGWDVVTVDGHDVAAICRALAAGPDGRPRLLLCDTVFGKGVSFMERRFEWHYLPMDGAQYAQALAEIEAAP